MALIGEMHYLTIGGNTYAIPTSGGSTVSVTRTLTSGTKMATISVDGTSYDLYAPTPNAGTVTKVTAGTGLSIGTTAGGNFTTSGTINHTNSVTAQTTQAVYPIKIDAQGHISAYGSAVTSMPASDVSAWAKASTKPSYNFSEIGSKPTTLSGYGITDAYTKTQVDGLVSGVLHYKGTKATVSALPTSGNTTGDVWHITADGSEWAWDGSAWQELGTAVDLSGYAQLSGASFTGPVTFGDSVTADELETGDLVVTGAASFTNNISANTINGVTVGNSPKFTDTTYSSLTAANGGTAVSLVTTGEKYTWNNKQDKLTNPVTGTGTSGYLAKWNGTGSITNGPQLGSTTTTYLNNAGSWATPPGTATGHTHSLSIAASTGTSSISLAANTKYQLSAGNNTYIFTTPSVPTKTSDLTNDGDGASAFATMADIGSFGGGTVTSVGVANATNGGLSISGSPVTTSGTITIGHSNVLSSAQTTQAVYPIKIDKNGHISAYGSAVTIPTATNSATTGITATTTATKTTLGTAFTIPNVTAAGSASTWVFEEVSIPNVTAAGSASTWTFGSTTVGDGTLVGAVDSSDTSMLVITAGTKSVQQKTGGANGTAPTIGTAIKVQSKKSGANGSAPTLGTAFTVPNVTGNTSATVSISDSGHTHTLS